MSANGKNIRGPSLFVTSGIIFDGVIEIIRSKSKLAKKNKEREGLMQRHAREEMERRNGYEPLLGVATTKELLDELDARNVGGQRPVHPNTMAQTADLIKKLRQAFIIRKHGLEYRTVD